MIKSILVVCMGNICRSPLGESLIRPLVPGIAVSSAGLDARQEMPVDTVMSLIAKQHGVDIADHRAERFTLETGLQHDLILAMEAQHLQLINQRFPPLSGRSLLFSHFAGKQDIPDPYRKSHEYYHIIFQLLSSAATAWGKALGS